MIYYLVYKYVRIIIETEGLMTDYFYSCGLAALAMVATLIPIKQPISINNIFHEAELRGFTCKGEMFSVSNMKILAESFLAPWFCVEEFSDGMEANKLSIIEKLYAGALMMVPYPFNYNASLTYKVYFQRNSCEQQKIKKRLFKRCTCEHFL